MNVLEVSRYNALVWHLERVVDIMTVPGPLLVVVGPDHFVLAPYRVPAGLLPPPYGKGKGHERPDDYKGKGKGKPDDDKGKGKGKPDDDKGKGKGQPDDKGKGKGKPDDKGKGKGMLDDEGKGKGKDKGKGISCGPRVCVPAPGPRGRGAGSQATAIRLTIRLIIAMALLMSWTTRMMPIELPRLRERPKNTAGAYWIPLGYTAVSYFEQCKASVQSEWAMVLACVRYN